jgi:hypothetical protein
VAGGLEGVVAIARLRRQGEEVVAEMDATEEQRMAATAVSEARLEQKHANRRALAMMLVPTCQGALVVGGAAVAPLAGI